MRRRVNRRPLCRASAPGSSHCRRDWRPLSSGGAKAGNFKSVTFEIRTADGTTTKITATDKPQPDENNEARDASVVAKARIEQRGQARGAKAHDQSPHPVLLAAARERLIRNGR